MSAETLRRAAALMRERAEASLSPSPWHADDNSVWDVEGALVITSDMDILDDDIPHIASWHPAVALAVADWLELIADKGERNVHPDWYVLGWNEAVTVARAYLGESA